MGMASLLDLGTRVFWRVVGRRVDLAREHAWLDAAANDGPLVDEGWTKAYADRRGWRLAPSTDAGLLPSLAALDGPGFDAATVPARVREFYEHTARWQLDVWSQWSPIFQPGGALIALLFGRRVQQLALPIEPLAVAKGMTSRVVPFVDDDATQRAAAWIRTLKATGETVFSGCYSVGRLPGSAQPQVHVTFPLEAGNVQVFLTPSLEGGALVLRSTRGGFGEPGAYVVVTVRGRHYAARAPIHETFRVYVDDDGVLRTDHELRFGPFRALRLHYRLVPLVEEDVREHPGAEGEGEDQ